MLYREIIAVCSQIHTKHINTLCGQNVELLNVKPNTFEQRPLNPQFAGNMLPATQCYVACRNIGNKKKKRSVNPFPGKAEIKHWINFGNLWAVYLWSQYTTWLIHFVTMRKKNGDNPT